MEDVVELMENVIEAGLRAAFIVDGFGVISRIETRQAAMVS